MPGGQGAGAGGKGRGAGKGMGVGCGRRKGRMGGPFAAGPGGNCVCPNCRHTAPHMPGQPCNQNICPKCGIPMTRE